MINLNGKVSLITGASRGIGKEIALKLAKLGSDIVLVDINESDEAKSEVEALGRKALVLKADVSSMEQTKDVVEKALEEFGKVDILVNNAGITRDNLLMRMSEEDWDAVLDINPDITV